MGWFHGSAQKPERRSESARLRSSVISASFWLLSWCRNFRAMALRTQPCIAIEYDRREQRVTVFFHGNFGMNRKRMSRVLASALDHPAHRDKDLAKPFGYGAPFSAAYRSWLHKSGVIELRFPITLTPFGEVLREKDPGFCKKPTLWFFHQQLTADPDRAEAWNYFMGEFRALGSQFSLADLRNGLVMKLSAHDAKHFGPQSKMIPVIARKLLECYTSNDGLGSLNLLKAKNDGSFEFLRTKPEPVFSAAKDLAKAY